MPAMNHVSAIVQPNGDVKVVTRECMVCEKEGEVLVPKFDWEMYNKNPEMHIQDTLRRVSPGDREQIKTGIHDECWDKLFPEGEE